MILKVLARSGRIVLSALISGLIVWWTMVLFGGLLSLAQNLRLPAGNVGGPGLLGGLYIGLIGMIYAVPISLMAGIACIPASLVAIRLFGRTGGALTYAVGGAASALVTAVGVWLGMWAIAAMKQPTSFDEASSWLYLLGFLSIGGPIAGAIYWRLSRHETAAA